MYRRNNARPIDTSMRAMAPVRRRTIGRKIPSSIAPPSNPVAITPRIAAIKSESCGPLVIVLKNHAISASTVSRPEIGVPAGVAGAVVVVVAAACAVPATNSATNPASADTINNRRARLNHFSRARGDGEAYEPERYRSGSDRAQFAQSHGA